MDGSDDGYGTQQSYPQYRRVLVDGSGRVISYGAQGDAASQPSRIIYTSRQQPEVDHPRTQVYRIGPRFNASVTRLDRRGSVDSGLAQVIRVGGTAGPRVLRVGPGRFDNERQRASQAGGPPVIHLGSGRMRVVDADAGAVPQRMYRVVAADPNSPPRSAVTSHPRAAGPLPFQQFQRSKSGGESLPVSPDSGPRVISYRIHPVRSETDFSRPAAVYSAECHAPVNQYQGGPGTCSAGSWTAASDDDQYDSRKSGGSLSRGNSGEVEGCRTLSGADDRRAVRIQIGGTSDESGRGSNEGAGSLKYQVYQTQVPAQHETSYYYNNQQPSFKQLTYPSSLPYSDSGVTPSFTVEAVGPVTDFGELVCESIRQFLIHKQRQQQQQQESQGQTAVPLRRPRDFLAQSSVVGTGTVLPTTATVLQEKPSSSDKDPTAGSSDIASPTTDDRNMFQRYNFQFGSIGNFSRGAATRDGVSDVATPTTTTGSRDEQVRRAGSSSTAPIAVFRFQDFDDMVANMRDQNITSAANTARPSDSQARTDDHHKHQQQQQAQLQKVWESIPLHSSVDEETDEDSGYSTAQSVADCRCRDVMAPVVTPISNVQVPASRVVDSREVLRQKISAFNNNSRGFIMSLEQNSDVFHGFIRVVMNLIRPVQMALSSQPTSIYDATVTSRDQDSSAKVTTFHLPKDTTKVIHITSETTTRDVIQMLLAKFHIQDNPRKFALYEQLEDQDQRGGYMRRLVDIDRPLPLCLRWADAGIDALNRTRFVLQENDTGEIMWEAFSLPELESFLLILHKEEETYLQEIRENYCMFKIQMQQRLKQLKHDRVGPGAKLKPVVA